MVLGQAARNHVEGVARDDRQALRIPERFRQARGEDGILLDRRHRTAAAKHLLGEDAEAGTDFQHLRRRGVAAPRKPRVDDRLQGVAVDEEVLSQHLVRVEVVFNAPGLHLARTRQIHVFPPRRCGREA